MSLGMKPSSGHRYHNPRVEGPGQVPSLRTHGDGRSLKKLLPTIPGRWDEITLLAPAQQLVSYWIGIGHEVAEFECRNRNVLLNDRMRAPQSSSNAVSI